MTMDTTTVLLLCLILTGVSGSTGGKEERQAAGDFEQRLAAIESSLETCGCSSQPVVAFKTHLSHSFTPAANQIIVFDDVQLNEGQAYHEDNGMFTAPRNGIYLFSVSICSIAPHYIVLDLVNNGSMIGRILAGDRQISDCSSETTIVHLTAGDNVYLMHHQTSGDLLGFGQNVVNSFTGALLKSL